MEVKEILASFDTQAMDISKIRPYAKNAKKHDTILVYSKAKDYSSGSYVVGEDIAPGTYNFTLVNGEGNLDTDDGELNEIMSNDQSFGTTVFHNAALKKGQTLQVSGCTVKGVPESK